MLVSPGETCIDMPNVALGEMVYVCMKDVTIPLSKEEKARSGWRRGWAGGRCRGGAWIRHDACLDRVERIDQLQVSQ